MTEAQIKALLISIHAPREGSDVAEAQSALESAISIHAPREGSDQHQRLRHARRHHFNPRSPRGERLQAYFNQLRQQDISIHAPREGSD